jgi:SAM-dependent methyltransferase
MSPMCRCVRPEALDELDPEDPRAQRSRRDLQRVHRAMGSLAILRNSVSRLRLAAPPKSIVELGAGDGTLLLRLARALKPQWEGVALTLLDRQRVVDLKTLENYRKIGWRVQVVCEDALVWANEPATKRYDLCITTLFLHHFKDRDLHALLTGVAARSEAFIASEPRRDRLADLGSHLVGLLGTNAVTRADAIKSVAAGFTRDEISTAWPKGEDNWWIQEFRALPFSHCFLAARDRARGAR